MLDQIETALNELKAGEKRNFIQSIDLIISLKGIDLKKAESKFSEDIILPHGKGKDATVAVFSDNLSNLGCDVFTTADIQRIAADKREAKKTAGGTDFFLSEAPLMPLIGKSLGQILSPRGKMPKVIIGDVRKLIENYKKSVRVAVKNSPVIQCFVGKEDMETRKIAENIETVRIPPVGRGNITQALWGNVSANMLVFHFDNNADRTSYDSSPNVLNGIISGTWSNATGIYGQAINLTGNNPNVNLSTDVWNIGDASSGAVSFWTNLNSITAGHNYQLDFESALTITICCPNGIYYWLGNGPQGEVFVNITATKNTWYFITYTWDGTAGFAYLNGEYQGKQTTKGSPNWDWASQPSRIGSNQAGTSNMVGALDEFLFFNKNLSATEISQMYQNGNGRLGGNANNLTALGAEETPSTSESDGRSAIEQGIKDSLGVNAVIYTDQQVYTRNITGGQQLAKFDKFTLNGTKRWTFNYVTTGESFTNMMNITPSLYILEMQSLSTSDIRVKVSDFINQTK